jgi:cell division protein FtsL
MKIPTLEQCADFLRNAGPINSGELSKALQAKLTAAQLRERIRQEQASISGYLASKAADLDRMERESKAAKTAREASFKATEEAFRKQREQRLAIERKAASKAPAPAPAAQAPAPASRRPVAKTLPASPITRSVFAKLTPAEKMAYIKSGGKLI